MCVLVYSAKVKLCKLYENCYRDWLHHQTLRKNTESLIPITHTLTLEMRTPRGEGVKKQEAACLSFHVYEI